MIWAKEKFYPKIWMDKWGKKFSFHYWKKHFTMRFSWRPMIMMEKYFVLFWGNKEVFMKIYNLASEKKSIPSELTRFLEPLKKSMDRIREINDVFDLCDDDQKSPFVIYVNDFNAYK